MYLAVFQCFLEFLVSNSFPRTLQRTLHFLGSHLGSAATLTSRAQYWYQSFEWTHGQSPALHHVCQQILFNSLFILFGNFRQEFHCHFYFLSKFEIDLTVT